MRTIDGGGAGRELTGADFGYRPLPAPSPPGNAIAAAKSAQTYRRQLDN